MAIKAGDGTSDARRAMSEMQAAMLNALRSSEPLPEEMRLHLCFAFENLCAGKADDLVTPVKKPGGREPPIAKHTQEDAIRYLRWCDDGRIKDLSPLGTVGTAYGVGTRTVRNWREGWGDKPTPPLLEDGDTEPAVEAERVVECMRHGGNHYQRFKPKAKARRKT